MSTTYSMNPNTPAPAPFTITYDSGTQQEAIIVAAGSTVAACVSFDVAGSASLECTNFPYTMIEAGTAEWVPWANGTISVTTSAVASGITAIRLVRVSGTPRLTLTIVRS